MGSLGRVALAAAFLGVVLIGAAPRPTFDPANCQVNACGNVTFDRTSGPVGQVVTVTVDNGFFGWWTPEEWATWCGQLGVAIPGNFPGGSPFNAPLTITGWSTATFVIPEMPLGTYSTALTCGGDGGFAQPAMPEAFAVVAGVPNTATADADRGKGNAPWWLASLAAGLIAGLLTLSRRARPRRP